MEGREEGREEEEEREGPAGVQKRECFPPSPHSSLSRPVS